VSDRSAASRAQVTALGRGRFVVDDGQRRRLAYATRAADATWVFLEGRVYLLRDGDSRDEGAHTDEETALSAPMPATIVAIEVSEGQGVSRGDILVRLEAMKMELAITAPRDGTVAAINGKKGDFVQPGTQLVELT
jgi:3-methylcrotonyl-CoA carboxylase alpha subunit